MDLRWGGELVQCKNVIWLAKELMWAENGIWIVCLFLSI